MGGVNTHVWTVFMVLLFRPMEEFLRTALSQCSQERSPGFIRGNGALPANSLMESR